MEDGATFRELLAYTDAETERWHAWLRDQPAEVLQVRIGEGSRATVRDLIGHVFAAELRYAQRLLGQPATAYEELEMGSLDALWRIHAEARRALRAYLDAMPASERDRQMTFNTRTLGTLSATAHKMAVHVFLHGIRHWAQIATALRQAGHPQPWEHDWLLSDAV
ncbi:MAG: DinB family protein [Gemmatimonadetes bacterium]|nr:DinB family protein [Gemmatimonadota bacterium]